MRGRAYIYGVIAAGAMAVLASFIRLVIQPIDHTWLILAALTVISGSATVKLPSIPASLSVSETFVFTCVLLFGPAAGTLTVALDGLIISLWLKKRRKELHRVLFNMAAPALSIWISSHIFFLLAGIPPLQEAPAGFGAFIFPLVVFTLLYFGLNSALITFAVATETGGAPIEIWRTNFLWLSLNFFCGASVAALLTAFGDPVRPTYLAAILPLLLVLYLTYRTSMARVEDANLHLTQVNTLYLSTIETLAMAIDAKDQVTHGHIRRVQAYANGLAKSLGVRDSAVLHAVEAASLLHDMGKLAIPEHILNKPGRLTASEFEKMKMHAAIGADILSAIRFPYPVVPIVRHHHESWNGTGYPDGLSGVDIPIGARILAVVDCFDALTSDRPYRPALSAEQALAILLERRGTMYDPLVVDTFIRIHSHLGPELGLQPPPQVISAIAHGKATGAEARLEWATPEETDSSDKLLIYSSLLANAPGQLGVNDLCELSWYHLRRIVPLTLLAIYRRDEPSDALTPVMAVGPNGTEELDLLITVGEGLSGWVAANRRVITNSDPRLDLGLLPVVQDLNLKSSCSVPLQHEDELVGVLTVYSDKAAAFSDADANVLSVVAPRLAIALNEASAFDSTRHSSRWDEETGLPNRTFLEEFVGAGGQFRRTIGTLMLVSIGGMPEGSSRAVARALKSSLRVGDLVFRLCDDQFVCVLSGSDPFTTDAIVTRIAEALHSCDVEGRWVGIGVASPPSDGVALEQLLAAARAGLRGVREELLSRPRTG